jgi:colanic acid/amylovoran biosynthesis glycosyltransferase
MARIVLIVPSFPKLSESFIVSKFLELLERGWDAHIVCGKSELQQWSQFSSVKRSSGLKDKVHVMWPHRPRWLAAVLIPAALLRLLLQSPAGTWRYLSRGCSMFGLDVLRRLYLDAELIRLKPEVVHFEFGALAAGRTYLKDLLDCKLVVSFRGYDLNFVGLENAGFYEEVWKSADAIHLLGHDLWLRALRRGCPPQKRHYLIPPAIDTEYFDPGSREHAELVGTLERPLRILSVGRLDWKKGYEYGLEAVRALVDQSVCCEYRVIGDGDYLEPIAFARHQLALEDCVKFMGALSRDHVRTQMLWADVLLHSAVSEGFCNAVVEAQAMALPVVCADADGLSENVADGKTGFVVQRRNPKLFAEKLLQLAREPGLRQRMGQTGRRRVLERFQLPDQIASLERLYLQVLGAPLGAGERCAREVLNERES